MSEKRPKVAKTNGSDKEEAAGAKAIDGHKSKSKHGLKYDASVKEENKKTSKHKEVEETGKQDEGEPGKKKERKGTVTEKHGKHEKVKESEESKPKDVREEKKEKGKKEKEHKKDSEAKADDGKGTKIKNDASVPEVKMGDEKKDEKESDHKKHHKDDKQEKVKKEEIKAIKDVPEAKAEEKEKVEKKEKSKKVGKENEDGKKEKESKNEVKEDVLETKLDEKKEKKEKKEKSKNKKEDKEDETGKQEKEHKDEVKEDISETKPEEKKEKSKKVGKENEGDKKEKVKKEDSKTTKDVPETKPEEKKEKSKKVDKQGETDKQEKEHKDEVKKDVSEEKTDEKKEKSKSKKDESEKETKEVDNNKTENVLPRIRIDKPNREVHKKSVSEGGEKKGKTEKERTEESKEGHIGKDKADSKIGDAGEKNRDSKAHKKSISEGGKRKEKEEADKDGKEKSGDSAEKHPKDSKLSKEAPEVKVTINKDEAEKGGFPTCDNVANGLSKHKGGSKRSSRSGSSSDVDGKSKSDPKDTLIWIIKNQDKDLTNTMIAKMDELNKIKDEIARKSKRNFLQEKEISDLDKKIFVLVKNKMAIEETLATTNGSVSSLRRVTMQAEDPTSRELYGQLFYLLQHETVYVTLLTSQILLGEVDTLLQIVMFTLYGNQYEEDEEHLLLTVFRDVLSSEVANAMQPNVMFRSNTSLTRMLTTYARRAPGLQFLKVVLEDWLKKIVCDSSLDLEIFPDKVRDMWIADYRAQQGLPPDDSGMVSDDDGCIGGISKEIVDEIIQGIIQPRIPCIEELIAELLDSLERHLEDIPYGIRWICKQTKHLVAERWPELPEEQQCSLVGGFFILRYLNPAIITPNAFGIIPQNVSLPAHSRRNLTILAKVVQNLSNGVTFSTIKEAYMSVLNFILTKYQAQMIKILGKLSDVEDLDHHLGLDTYAGLTKLNPRNNTIRITLNEMYFVHDLINKHKDTVFASLSPTDKIFGILNAIPTPPAQKLSDAENHEIELQLIPPNARDGDDEAQLSRIAPERLLSDAKYAMFLLIHKLPKTILRKILDMGEGKTLDNIPAFLKHVHKWGMEQDMIDRINELAEEEDGTEEEEDKGSDKKKKKDKRASKGKKGKNLKVPKKKTNGQITCELADKVLSILKQLAMIGVLCEEDNYAEFRKDLSEVVTGIGAQIERLDRDKERLCSISKSLDDKYAVAQQVAASYNTYLTNVRQRASTFSVKKKSTPAVIPPSTQKLAISSTPSTSSSPAPLPHDESEMGKEGEEEEENDEKAEKEHKKEKEGDEEDDDEKEPKKEGEGEKEHKKKGKESDGEKEKETKKERESEKESEKKGEKESSSEKEHKEAAEIPRVDENIQKKTVLCSHGSLSRDKIIVETKLDPKTLSRTTYEFSSDSPGIYKIQIAVDKKVVGNFDLFFEDLLEKQLVGSQVFSNEYCEFDVSNLIFFLNRRFNNVKN